MSLTPTPTPPPHGTSRTALFGLLVQDVMRPRSDVLAVRPGTRCADMISLLAFERASCAVVLDSSGQPIGIVTEQDIARRITYRLPPETAVETVMTTPVLTIQGEDYLYHAVATSLRHKLRHLPVVDRRGRLVGILHLHESLACAAQGLLEQVERLSHEGTAEGLKEVKAAQVELAEQLFADNVPATEIQRLLTQINNDMYRRVGEAAVKDMADEGWGDLPLSAVMIVMGSGGRGENYLFPDQDNGLIIADYPDSDHSRIDPYFIELAERLCRCLNEVGIPYCNGYCMAVNPLWRKTLNQWIDQITTWGRKSDFVAIRLADIFFDFQPAWGNVDLARQLRRVVTRLMHNNRAFLKQMFQKKMDQNVALGLFGSFITEKERREYRGQVDLKYHGTLPLVGAVRLLALREGVDETPTLERIRALKDRGVFDARELEDLSQAFSLITELLLKRQIEDYRAGRGVTYYVNPNALSKRQRRLLQDSLRAIDDLLKRVDYEFTAQLF